MTDISSWTTFWFAGMAKIAPYPPCTVTAFCPNGTDLWRCCRRVTLTEPYRRAVSGNAVLRHKAKYQLFTRLILTVDSSNLRDNFVRNNTFLPSFPVPGHPYISKMLCAFTSIWNPETGTTTLTRTVGEISLSRFLPGYYCPDRLAKNSTAIAHRSVLTSCNLTLFRSALNFVPRSS